MTEDFYTLCSPHTEEEFARYYQFRWQHLRQPLNLPLGSEQDESESQAYHRMVLLDDQTIIGIGRIHMDTPHTAQVRFMAIHSNYQRRHIGSLLLADLLLQAKNRGAELCWLNARETACAFYQSQGFTVASRTGSLLNIPHFRMQKRLG